MQTRANQSFVKTDNHRLNMQLAQIANYCEEVERQSTFVGNLLALSSEMAAVLNTHKKYRPMVDRWMHLVKGISQ